MKFHERHEHSSRNYGTYVHNCRAHEGCLSHPLVMNIHSMLMESSQRFLFNIMKLKEN